MSQGQWEITEQAETGEVQYVIARLEETGSTDPQQLTGGNTSASFNIAGYSQGSISFKTDTIGGSPTATLEGSLDDSNWFTVSTTTTPTPIVATTNYEIKWAIPLKLVRITILDFLSDVDVYFTLMAEA